MQDSSAFDVNCQWFHDKQNCKNVKNASNKNIELINNANQAAACLVEYVNKVGVGKKKFKSLEELKQHMTKEAAIDKKKNGGVSSEEEEEEKDVEYEEKDED